MYRPCGTFDETYSQTMAILRTRRHWILTGLGLATLMTMPLYLSGRRPRRAPRGGGRGDTVGRAAELGLRASSFDEKSRGAVEPYRGTEAGASLGFRLASVLRLSFEADYRRRRTTLSRDDVDDLRAGAFLSIVPRTRGQEPRTLLPR